MSYPGTEQDPRPRLSKERITQEAVTLLERFRATKTKIAIQKDGTLTDIARSILLDSYGICAPASPKGRVPVSVSDDGETGFLYARNRGICSLVTDGAVDMAIVGTDRLIEDHVEDKVDILTSFRDRYAWSLVLATPSTSSVRQVKDIQRVATQYPVITSRYFESLGRLDVDIVTTAGGTELYPYLEYDSGAIDAIVDLTATGESLAAHDMVPWTPTIGDIYPVLIQAKREPQ